jgi:hypothetical protein
MSEFSSSSSMEADPDSGERAQPPLSARGPRSRDGLSQDRRSSVNRRVVKEKREVLPWSYPLMGFAGVFLLCLVYLGQYAALVRTQYQIVGLKSKQHHLAREEAQMELQVQRLTSLERVEHIASVRLGMAVPPGRQVLELHPGSKRIAPAGKTVGMVTGMPVPQ